MSEQEAMDSQEAELPPLSGQAFNAAFNETLKAGNSVLISGDGSLIEVFANGERKFIRSIDPPVRIPVGTKIQLR